MRHGYDSQSLIQQIQDHVPGLSISSLTIASAGSTGAVISGDATFNSIPLTGAASIFVAANGTIGFTVLSASIGPLAVPGQPIAQQIASAAGTSVSGIDLGYIADVVYVCNSSILIIDGHTAS